MSVAKTDRPFLLFDFDGVIVDSFEACYQAAQRAYPGISPQAYRRNYLGNVFAADLGNAGVEADHARMNMRTQPRAQVELVESYHEALKQQRMHSGIAQVISALSRSHELCVVSSSMSWSITQFLHEAGLLHHFTSILGGDVHMSKRRKIAMVAGEYGLPRSQMAFVTDTLGDILEATRAGIRSYGVSWGFHAKEVLALGDPIAVAETPLALFRAIKQHA